MLSGVLKILVLFFSIFIISDAKNVCTGESLSAFNMLDVKNLTEMAKKPHCTHIVGDIIIQNLVDVELPVQIYKRIRVVFGSIIIVNNTNIVPPIFFQSLRVVNASLLPAITILGNKNVMMHVGNYFKKAVTQNKEKLMFAVLLNSNQILDTSQYNVWYLAGYPNSKFLMDSLLQVKVCGENFYKPIAGILGFLFVALTLGFSTVAFYDRPNLKI
ncbi:hypothetical protein GCK72_019522 [Caenorhabditis remanei]|uniref:Receptor L-domain domain-containing protein n=1 Tax=Caenorhabditis remanei TaxID=31234 RepID=A0A6A5GCJ0_CAERE|nr:hypothetical protein GCK72_019522 [Caenorhabditis remanei]KAF1752967.1 hypothetical protein GCK72_019522 [Caenorhabditis remanei]